MAEKLPFGFEGQWPLKHDVKPGAFRQLQIASAGSGSHTGSGARTDASSNDCVGAPASGCAYPCADGGAYRTSDCGRLTSTSGAADFTLLANLGLHVFLTGDTSNRSDDRTLAILGIDF